MEELPVGVLGLLGVLGLPDVLGLPGVRLGLLAVMALDDPPGFEPDAGRDYALPVRTGKAALVLRRRVLSSMFKMSWISEVPVWMPKLAT
ncbi:hypothetical protein B0H14DRAFT_2665211 [Mycena olivaceomarginata]|nr:hypothetical protein B0H14DRAFT_2665211 [Mycena olivaceomarginata]